MFCAEDHEIVAYEQTGKQTEPIEKEDDAILE